MFDSEWLDIAIGVVFVWFIFSLAVSATNEAINRLLAVRSKQLWLALGQVLDDQRARGILATTFGPLLSGLGRPLHWWRHRNDRAAGTAPSATGGSPKTGLQSFDPRPRGESVTDRDAARTPTATQLLYSTRAVLDLDNKTRPNARTRLSNIPARVFSQALIELGALPPDTGTGTGSAVPTGAPAGAPAAGRTCAADLSAADAAPAIDAGPPPTNLPPPAPSTPKTPDDLANEAVERMLARLPETMQAPLRVLWLSADHKIETFRELVEQWFDAQMVRLTRFYRTQLRIILLIVAAIVTLLALGAGLRADSLRLVSDLQRDQDLRTVLTGLGAQVSDQDLKELGCPTATTGVGAATTSTEATVSTDDICRLKGAQKLQGLVTALKVTDLNLDAQAVPGTPTTAAIAASTSFWNTHNPFWRRLGGINVFGDFWGNWRALAGVLITAVAISFGATFWYDALRRLVGLRSRS